MDSQPLTASDQCRTYTLGGDQDSCTITFPKEGKLELVSGETITSRKCEVIAEGQNGILQCEDIFLPVDTTGENYTSHTKIHSKTVADHSIGYFRFTDAKSKFQIEEIFISDIHGDHLDKLLSEQIVEISQKAKKERDLQGLYQAFQLAELIPDAGLGIWDRQGYQYASRGLRQAQVVLDMVDAGFIEQAKISSSRISHDQMRGIALSSIVDAYAWSGDIANAEGLTQTIPTYHVRIGAFCDLANITQDKSYIEMAKNVVDSHPDMHESDKATAQKIIDETLAEIEYQGLE